jgi:peptidoglycan L-alanyl-D-glutamate endopeptidase CwlK
MFQFGNRSQALLLTVKPALQILAHAAIALSDIDFGVVQGARTIDQQKRLFGQGRTAVQCQNHGVPAAYARPDLQVVTWTLNSNHIGGNAIDVCPCIGDTYDWDNSGAKGYWPRIHAAFVAASHQTGIPVYWGGAFSTPDRPHFSLVPG